MCVCNVQICLAAVFVFALAAVYPCPCTSSVGISALAVALYPSASHWIVTWLLSLFAFFMAVNDEKFVPCA